MPRRAGGPRRPVRGGDDHGVGVQDAVRGHDPPATGRLAAQLGHRGAGDDLAAARADRVGDGEREGAHAALDAHEHGPGLLVGRHPRLDLADALRQRGVGPRDLEELRDRRAHRDAVRVARVDPAEKGFDEAVDDLAACARRHVRTDRHVVADLGAGQLRVLPDAGEALLGQHAGQGLCGAGNAHDVALGHGAQGAAGPDRGGRGGGRLEAVVEAHLAGEGHRLRPAGQHRLGAEVDAGARDLAGQQLAADPVGCLQHGDARTAPRQPVRGGQSCDAGSDDDDP